MDVVRKVLNVCKFANTGRRRLHNDNIQSCYVGVQAFYLRNKFLYPSRRPPEDSTPSLTATDGYSETLHSFPGTTSFGKCKEREKKEQAFGIEGQRFTASATAFSALAISTASTSEEISLSPSEIYDVECLSSPLS